MITSQINKHDVQLKLQIPHVIIITLFFLYGSILNASDYYVCDCAIGSDVDCIAGDNNNSGTSQNPWQSYDKARTTFATMPAGDSIHFCDGGYWEINGANDRWSNSNCRADNVCSVGNYIAGWASGDESLPILERLDNQDQDKMSMH